ncbi:hypothetical protein NE850_10780 [Paraburkholderia sp. USG1]|uniref:LamG-like jellyroll fold domain-containing protein n=1 Tax=Paraburkholderia sp. USG1 TaxID=2952268 RepID=UPI0028674884|nr:LamG-like jellyroll fold domain-containing protein [Paraburkholderia sp. USG1]MDR8396823.1 hypothetical protein [Paraburkholderia sp. USG1]
MTRHTVAQFACGLALLGALGATAALSGCGGASQSGSGNVNNGAGGTPASTPAAGTAPPARKMLLIELDGVTYSALSAGIAGGKLPNLAKLTVAPAYSGGVNGTLSQQPNLDTPGWASVLTGTWADRHQINSDAPNQALHSSTVFQRLKSAGAGSTGAVVDSESLAALLSPDQNAGYLNTLVNCASVDTCVTQTGAGMIGNGYSFVVAQYHSAQDAALNTGLASTNYANTLVQLDAAVGTLIGETAKRSNESWLVMVTAGHGLNAAGGTDGLPLPPESTSFIALNQTPNARLGNTAAPATMAALYTRASIADVTPTLLAYQGALPDAASYALDGGQLLGATPVSQLLGTTGSDNASLVLKWTAPASGAISVLRNGSVIASLPAGTATYTDNQLGLTTTGVYPFNYTVVAGSAPLSTITQVVYVQPPPPPPPPPPLATTLTTGLSSYYPFGALPPADRLNASTMGPWAADADAGTLVADPFGGKGLQIDTHTVDSNGFDGYKLAQIDDVTTHAQFTIGFWFYTSCANLTGNGTPVFSNKNYYSGGNAGIAIGLFPGSGTSCNIRFNVGDGSTRNDINSLNVSANKWTYLALSIDTAAKTINAYIFDPVLGEQKVLGQTLSVNIAKLPGLGVFGLNEDGTGRYYMNACNDSPPYTVGECAATPPDVQAFSDLALWTRIVTEAELQSVYGSGQPLSTLIH